MRATQTYKCQQCDQPFTARVADRNRGWARFCSKSCKAVKQEAHTGQYSKLLGKPHNVSVEQFLDQREYGGNPQYDRQGNYIGFTQ